MQCVVMRTASVSRQHTRVAPGICRRVLLAWLIGLIALPALAAARPTFRSDPTYVIDTWEIEDGLPENSATAMVQMSDGYLWFGTFAGLVRFDGVDFTVLTTANTPELPDFGIVNLHLDKSGRMWVSTYGGMAVLTQNKWRRVDKPDGWREGDYARTFAERDNGDLLVTTFTGKVLEYSKDRFTELPSPPGEAGKGYHGLVGLSGDWWVTQSASIARWDGKRWIPTTSPAHAPAATSVSAQARDGGAWMLLGRDLIKLREGRETSRRTLPEEPGGGWSLFEDSRGNVWVCTLDRGVCRIAPDGEMRRWNTSNGLVYNGVRFVLEDREGNLWIGTSGGGLNRFKLRRFKAYGVESNLPERVVKSVSPAPGGGMWIGTYGKGLFRINEPEIREVPLSTAGGTGGPALVQSVLTDRTGRTWVGSLDQGLWVMDKSGWRRIPDQFVGGGNVTSLFEDSRNRIWMGDGHGVTMFDGESSNIYAADRGLPRGAVRCFAEDGDGDIWLTNPAGLFRWKGERFIEVRDSEDKPFRDMSWLKPETGGAMWMGTLTGGLMRLRTGGVDRIDERVGLPRVSFVGILKDDYGYFWLATNRGVIRVLCKALEAVADGRESRLDFQLLGLTDGLPSVECAGGNQPACGQDVNGKLWFATVKGVASINPADFQVNTSPPTVHIEELVYSVPTSGRRSLRHFRESRLKPPFEAQPSLPPGSRQIELHYAGLSFAAPEKVRFETMLEGRDAEWQDLGDRRIDYFNDLGPGHYVFRVRAANNDGVWNQAGASLAFAIEPFFWQTLWFRVGIGSLLVLVGAAAAWSISHQRHRRAREADEHFRQVVEASLHAMISVNKQGRVVMANSQAETVFGYAREEIIGLRIERLIPGGLRERNPGRFDSSVDLVASTTGAVTRELSARRKDGSEIPVEVGVNPVCNGSGALALVCIVDITARRQMERDVARQRYELSHLSRVNMLGELSGSLAHELNQPLTAILSNAQAAQRFRSHDDVDLNEVRAILGDIVSEDKRAGEVIRRLRLLLKKGEVQSQPMDVNEAVQDVMKLVHSDLLNHGIAAYTELAAGLPAVTADRVQIQQVLVNLVMNACDAMGASDREHRNLLVSTARDNGDVLIRVTDEGSGISPDRLDVIFEPFVTTKEHGMGLGLSVCRTIVAAHAGRLWATNNAGCGACFCVSLPACEGVPA
jgi:PAS domain S-box-containing protein